MNWLDRTHIGDCRQLLAQMAAEGVRVQCCVTSPPYWGLRDYGMPEQLGLDATPAGYVASLVAALRSVRDCLSDDGTLWLNLGDCYATGAGKVGECPGGGEQGARWAGKNLRPRPRRGATSQMVGRDEPIGPRTQPNRMPQEGLKPKDLVGIPWRVAFALQDDGWYLRSDIIWHKPNPMPESVTDRPTKSHEYIFLLAKSEQYHYDASAIAEPATGRSPGNVTHKGAAAFASGDAHHPTKAGLMAIEGAEFRNTRSVWTMATQPFSGAHFAVFPEQLAQRCVLASSRPGDTVLDPFMGSGTTAKVAESLGRHFIGCELNPAYVALHEDRRTTIGMPL